MLRRLEEKDVPFMLEWMRDETITCYFRCPFASMTPEKVKKFIKYSFDEDNQHFAITDDKDEYLGTVSLKHISEIDHNAEYAIVTRKKAHGTGIAARATMEILKYAFNDLGLHRIYLTVLSDNIAARKLYENCGFDLEGEFRDMIRLGGRYRNQAGYAILNWKEKLTENSTAM
ncbi:MAG: GNAT family N-acetyltransferase [Lachnospiraceae bacterium]|nr:GNAT family N-acetyltransferase [Lachnospiraceae bacterium]